MVEQTNMKKIRKELSKKLDVNVDKDYVLHSLGPKTPMDRKISKSGKASKSRPRNEDKENSDNKSSKKKIIHR